MTDKDKMSEKRYAEISNYISHTSRYLIGEHVLNCLQELKAEIDRLKAKNAKLQKEVEYYESLRDALTED